MRPAEMMRRYPTVSFVISAGVRVSRINRGLPAREMAERRKGKGDGQWKWRNRLYLFPNDFQQEERGSQQDWEQAACQKSCLELISG